MTAALATHPQAAETPAPLLPPSSGVNIPLGKIVRSKTNRKVEVSDDFVADIRKNGVLQNIIVRPIKATIEHVTEAQPHAPFALGETIYEIVFGERRWLASKKAGRSFIGAQIRNLTDVEAMEMQIRENEIRENYSPMDRAEAYSRLLAKYMEANVGKKGYTETRAAEHIAVIYNRETRSVQEIVSLSRKLCWQCQAALRNGEMQSSHAYEIARRPEDEQIEILSWIRKETQHSQGDVPSVRRLKDVIRRIDIAAEDRRRQQKLFTPPQPGTATTRVPTVAEAAATTRVAGHPAPQPQRHELAHEAVQKAIKDAKPHTTAQLKKQANDRVKFEQQMRKNGILRERDERIERKYKASFFAALASKVQISSRFLTHVVPNLILELWDINEIPIEAYAQSALGWPAPKQGDRYTHKEILAHGEKHTRKFSPKLLAALIVSLNMVPNEAERLAKYFGVDPKKLRQKAAAEFAAERLRVPKPKTPKDKVLFSVLESRDKEWTKLRKSGASDKQIRELLCARFGEYGGHGSPNEPWITYRGTGNNPRVWFKISDSGTPDLAGSDLVAKVRELLNISQEGAA
jgi:ParB/RepB/Spo0J family partition protein